MSFDQLGLRVELLKAVKNKGYEAPTAIQAQAVATPLVGATGLPPLTIAFVVATWAVLLGRRACRARR